MQSVIALVTAITALVVAVTGLVKLFIHTRVSRAIHKSMLSNAYGKQKEAEK